MEIPTGMILPCHVKKLLLHGSKLTRCIVETKYIFLYGYVATKSLTSELFL